MPQKKDHKCSHHTESFRWHNFHFSGKVIVCSVLLGLMLVLIGGILMATGMDHEDDTKSGNYDDIQKKPPTIYVGPVVMGIGGFAVIVGVVMCLFETQVCRKKNTDASPLIPEEGADAENKDSEPAAVPSTSNHRDKHRYGTRKKSPSPRRYKGSSKKSTKDKNQMEASLSSSQSSFSSGANGSKNFLTASDKFLTPPGSFPQDAVMRESNSAENQATASFMQSFTSSGKSWNTSTEFQTPAASFKEDPISLQFTDRKDELSLNAPTKTTRENENHKFLTPKNSDAENGTPISTNNNVQKQENAKEETPEVLDQECPTSSKPINIQENMKSPEASSETQIVNDIHKDCNQTTPQSVSNISENARDILDNDFSESSSAKERNSSSEVVSPRVKKPERVSQEILKENQSAACSGDIESNIVSREEKESYKEVNNDGSCELLNVPNVKKDTSDINESESNIEITKIESEDISTLSNNENIEETT